MAFKLFKLGDPVILDGCDLGHVECIDEHGVAWTSSGFSADGKYWAGRITDKGKDWLAVSEGRMTVAEFEARWGERP